MKMALTIAVALLATTAQGQFIDYDKLFADRTADLTTRQLQNGQTVTDLRGENTVITRDPEGNYISYATQGSAPGCYFEILISLQALAKTCPATFGKDRSDNLADMIAAFSTFMARNAYPPMTVPQVAQIVTSKTSSLQSNLTQTDCDPQRNADMDGWLRMADGLSQQDSRAAINTLPDMLPVTNPCL